MKIATSLSILLFISISADYSAVSAEYNWNKVPYPSEISDSNTLYSIHAFNENEAIAVGSNGTIIHVKINENVYFAKSYGSNTFRWICFADSVNGWAVGDNGIIYMTNDRGANWIQQLSGVKNKLNAVAAVDKNNAWIAGDSGTILHTANGGKNWYLQKLVYSNNSDSISDSDSIDFVSIAFKNGAMGCIGGNQGTSLVPVVMVTSDTGAHWVARKIIDHNAYNLYEVAFNDETPIVFVNNLIGENLELMVDSNYEIPYVHVVLNSLKRLNTTQLNHFCSNHKVLQFRGISSQTMFAIDSIDPFTFWVAGTQGSIFQTRDIGKNWLAVRDVKNLFIDDLEIVFFNGSRYGFIGGRNGTLLFSEDSGSTWKQTTNTVNAFRSYKSIAFIDSLNGFLLERNKALYSYPKCLITSDGGRTWILGNDSPDNIEILRTIGNGVFGLNLYNMFTFSLNGGKNWQVKQLNKYIFISDFFPFTQDTFFVLGSRSESNEGAIFKSTDFGNTLDLISSVNHADSRNKNFYSITFSDTATGWVVGDSGLILKSSDSGYTWQRQASPTTDTLCKIRFCNQDFGWISGSSTIFLTFDGGATWQDKSIMTSAKVSDVFCSDPQNCWAVGDDGLILHLSNKLEKFIKITSPLRNDVFSVGDSIIVKWNSAGVAQVSIAISYDNGQNYTIYRSSIENDGEESIRITANAKASNACKLRIKTVEGTVLDESELFTINGSSAIENPDISFVRSVGCQFSTKSIQYFLVEDSPVEITIFSVSGKLVYRNAIPLQAKGYAVEQIPYARLNSGCYLARVKIGERLFSAKLLLQK